MKRCTASVVRARELGYCTVRKVSVGEMFRRLRTKVKEQGFRSTVKETGVIDVLGVFALIAIFAALAVLAARPCAITEDPSAAGRITLLQHKIDLLEAKTTAIGKQNSNLPALAKSGQPEGTPADSFEEEETALSDEEGTAYQLDLDRAQAETQDISAIKRSGPRPDGRVELEPINTGCYEVRDRAECCKKVDSRYTIHGPPYFGGVPCMPSVPGVTFKTGNVCEPETYASTDMQSQSCDGEGDDEPDNADEDESGAENKQDSNDPDESGDEREAKHHHDAEAKHHHDEGRSDADLKESGDDSETLAEVIQRQKKEAGARRVPAAAPDLNLIWVTYCQT